MIRKGITKDEALRRTAIVNDAFPDALVENYEPLIPTLTLPDEKDNLKHLKHKRTSGAVYSHHQVSKMLI